MTNPDFPQGSRPLRRTVVKKTRKKDGGNASRPSSRNAVVLPPGPRVTILKSSAPSVVAKSFNFKDGKLGKTSVANITTAAAASRPAGTAEELSYLVRNCSERRDCAMVLGTFVGDVGQSFRVVPKATLARMLKKDEDNDSALAGIHTLDNQLAVAARLKVSIRNTVWVLFDADDAPNMPPNLKRLTARERLVTFDRIVPGLSLCERVLARSSSRRVRHKNETPAGHGHIYIRVSDPDKIDLLRLHIDVAAVNAGLSFVSPAYDRTTGAEIRQLRRTLFDTSVLVSGRLVFTACPLLEPSAIEAGYVCDDADVVIENPGGGALDLSHIELPGKLALDNYRKATGVYLSPRRRRDGVGLAGVIAHDVLKSDTIIERRGQSRMFAQWLDAMKPGAKLRCESPWRESNSEAAFIKKNTDGSAFVYDSGTATTAVWHGDGRRWFGVPEDRIVIGVDQGKMRTAMMIAGINYGVVFTDAETLSNIWIEPDTTEVVVVWPDDGDPKLRQQMVSRLRAAHLPVTFWSGGSL